MKSYSGNGKPFVYAAYCIQDKTPAQKLLEELPCAVCFGADKKMAKAAAFVLILSPDAIKDESIRHAINTAEQSGKPILTVYLRKTELTPGLRMLLNPTQAIFAEDPDFTNKLKGADTFKHLVITPAQKKAAKATTIAMSVATPLILVFTVLAIVLANPYSGKVAADSSLGKLGLAGIEYDNVNTLYIYGEQLAKENLGTCSNRFKDAGTGEYVASAERIYVKKSGSDYARGAITDVSAFKNFKNLEELILAGNKLTDASPLFRLENVNYLNLAYDPVTSLKGIGSMKSLGKLDIRGTSVTDLAPLLSCPSLETVLVSEDMRKYADAIKGSASFDIYIADGVYTVKSFDELINAAAADPESVTITQPVEITRNIFLRGSLTCNADVTVAKGVNLDAETTLMSGGTTLVNHGETILSSLQLSAPSFGDANFINDGTFSCMSFRPITGTVTNRGRIVIEGMAEIKTHFISETGSILAFDTYTHQDTVHVSVTLHQTESSYTGSGAIEVNGEVSFTVERAYMDVYSAFFSAITGKGTYKTVFMN
ncbi:MAG: hypothetical protein WC547_08685 [Candidatus Omnitrophota bacterium]